MTRTLLIAVILALPGCATISDLRERAPAVSYSSPKSVGALEECLAGSLSWLGAPAIIHGEGTAELSFGRGYGDSFMIVRLAPNGDHTTIEVREKGGLIGRVRRNIEGCR